MALKQLELHNFRGKENLILQFGMKNRLIGENGVGKTTVREAITFGFLGTDSEGNRNPRHLITTGQSSAKVIVTTDKAEISRTLSAKGNGTLKLIRQGVPTTLTQSQLEQMLGSTDLFLSALIPGHFMKAGSEKQHKVISEVQPKVDREKLLFEISGLTLTPEEVIRYGATNTKRRPDLIASAISVDRREVEKSIERVTGERDGLSSITVAPKPEKPPEVARYDQLGAIKKYWAKYEMDLARYEGLLRSASQAQLENEKRATRRKEIERDLEAISYVEVPQDPGFEANYTALRSKLHAVPQKPALGNIVSSDHCPECGQTVGIKHRDHIKKLNLEAMGKHEKAVQIAQDHNAVIQKQIEEQQVLERQYNNDVREAQQVNTSAKARKQALEMELGRLPEVSAGMDVVSGPIPPAEPFDEAEYEKCSKVVNGYKVALTEHEYTVRQVASSQKRLQEISENLDQLHPAVERLRKLEDGFKEIPRKELELQSKAFNFPGLDVVISDRVEISMGGIPYSMLSTGQRMKSDVVIALQFNSLMKYPINMVFLDNADLVDQVVFPENIQWFTAEVVQGQTQLKIERNDT